MKLTIKRHLAKLVVFALLFLTAAGFTPAKKAAAADLSEFLNMEFGIKYSGTRNAVANEEKSAWNIEYFNVLNSAYKEGDEFYISCTVSGASQFKQVAIQSDVNNWNWAAAPKVWSEEGLSNGTVIAGKVTATADGDNLSFKMQFDNVLEDTAIRGDVPIKLTDLYIMKIGNANTKPTDLPEDKQISMGTPYSGTVTANLNEGAYEAQYFNVSDSSYSAGDTYIISYTLGGATEFKQTVIQSNLNNWDWATSPKLWAGNGLAEDQSMTGALTAVSSGDGVSFKIRVDSQVTEGKELGDSIELKLTDLIVVKVSNSTVLPLPNNMELNKDRYYSGEVTAVKDEKTGAWTVEYFNVNHSEITKGQQFKISFSVSGAKAFKQMAVQSNVNGWSWDDAPKIWKTEGIANGTVFSTVITATEEVCDKITFKLWFDNPVEEGFAQTEVPITLTKLMVKDVAPVESLNEAYQDYFTVGAAVSAAMAVDGEYQDRIKGFGTITAENEMKPDALLNQEASQKSEDGTPVLNLYNSGMTKILDFIKTTGLKVRGHALLYAAQTPDWFFHEGYTDEGDNVSSDVMESRMESYIKQVIQFVEENYPGVVTAWDVVNEAIDEDGSIRENNWTATMGNSYIGAAFKYASQYAPATAKLYYNDYNMENGAKQRTFTVIKSSLPEGARIDGIGMQTHGTLTNPDLDALGAAIDAYHNAGLDVQITELDVQIESNESLSAQADRYAALFTLFKEKADAISNVTLWGINDGNSWKSEKRPLLFYDDLTPKPAFDSILGLVKPAPEPTPEPTVEPTE